MQRFLKLPSLDSFPRSIQFLRLDDRNNCGVVCTTCDRGVWRASLLAEVVVLFLTLVLGPEGLRIVVRL